MLDQFLTFFNRNFLINREETILLAFSGGIDSVVLADLLLRSGRPIVLGHMNFGLRGAESEQDAAWAAEWAARRGVTLLTKRSDPAELARQQGISIQMAARQLRYEWLESCRVQYNCTALATAHHADDSIETVLLNFVRGTGIQGLAGIPVQQGNIIRPLLFATKEQIAGYAAEQGLQWREDSSNQKDTYARNRLRHHVVPILRTLNPGLSHTFQETSERLQLTARLLKAQAAHIAATHLQARPDGTFALDTRFLTGPPESRLLLAELLAPFGFSWKQTGQMVGQHQKAGAGQRFRSGTHELLLNREEWLLRPLPVSAEEPAPFGPVCLIEEANGTYQLMHQQLHLSSARPDPGSTDGRSAVCIDAELLQFPLFWRRWQQADRIRPLGMKGSQKVSDLLINLKVSRFEKEQITVLLSGEEIVWVIGYRLSERFKITNHTKRAIMAEVSYF